MGVPLLTTEMVLPLRVSAPWETTSEGWVVSPLLLVDVKVKLTGRLLRLTVVPPLIVAWVVPTVVPVPLAAKVLVPLSV